MGKTIGIVLSLKDKCSPAIVKIAQKFGLAETEAKKLNKQLNEQAKKLDGVLKNSLQGAVVGIGATIGAITALTSKTIQYGDNVDKMSQKIGMSRKSFQEWDYIMSQNGGNIENLQMGFKALSNQMDGVRKGSKDSIRCFQILGVSVKNNRGNFRAQEEVFNDTVKALQRMKNPTEKAIIAQKLFGKSAIEMKPLLNQTAEAVELLRQRANDLGIVMSDDVIDSSVKLTDTLDGLKRAFGAIGLIAGAELTPIVQSLADQLINNLPQIRSALLPVIEKFGNTIAFVCGHLDVIIPAVGALAGAFGALKIISSVAGFITAFCNPIGYAVLGITALIGALGVAYTKCAGFRSMVGATLSVVKLLAVGTWKVIQAVAQFSSKIVMLMPPIRLVVEMVKSLVNWINQLAQKAGGWQVIGNNIKNWADSKTSKIQGYALGTTSAKGGATLVGEYGPEIVNIPRGASVMNANNTKKALNGGANIVINMNIAGNVIGNREFLKEIMTSMAFELRKVMPA